MNLATRNHHVAGPIVGLQRCQLVGSRFDGGIAEITERRRALTVSDDLNTAATSGSSTTATVLFDIFPAKRFGLDLL